MATSEPKVEATQPEGQPTIEMATSELKVEATQPEGHPTIEQSIEKLVLNRKQPGSRAAYEKIQARKRYIDSLCYPGTKKVVASYSLKRIREEKEKNNESSRVASGSSGNRETVTVAPGSTDNVKTVTLFPNEVDVVVPRKSDKVMIMGGPYLGATGKLIGIDDMDGIVKLDDTLLVQIFDMAILTKHA